MAADSAGIPLWDAWAAAIDAGGDPPAALKEPRFYRGETPKGEPPAPGYYLFGLVTPAPGGFYNGQTGEDLRGVIHCWGETPDDALALYAWLRGLLHDVQLDVAGFGSVAGVVGGSGPVSDQTGSAWQVIATYDAEPIQQAA